MASPILKIRAGNTAPPWAITCKRNDGTIINLTNCSVIVVVARGTTVTNTGHQTATITTAASGLISYVPQTGDTLSPGTYKCDVKVTYSDTTFEVLYDQLIVKAKRTLQ